MRSSLLLLLSSVHCIPTSSGMMWDPGGSHSLWSLGADYSVLDFTLSCFFWGGAGGKLSAGKVTWCPCTHPAHSPPWQGSQHSCWELKLPFPDNIGEHFCSQCCCEGLEGELRGEKSVSSILIVGAKAAQTILVRVFVAVRKTPLSPWCR